MKVVFSRTAKADCRFHDFVVHKNLRVATRAVSAVERSADQLCLFLYSGKVVSVEGTRELVICGFPCITLHRIYGQ